MKSKEQNIGELKSRIRSLEKDLEKTRLNLSKADLESSFYNEILNESVDIIYKLDFIPCLKLVYISPSIKSVMNRRLKEAYLNPFILLKIVHPEYFWVVRDIAQKPKKYHKKPVDIKLSRDDGSLMWVEQISVFQFNEKGEVKSLIGIARDITEFKIKQEKFQETLKKYEALFESNANALLIIDAETMKIRDANAKAQEMYGYADEEFKKLRANQICLQPENTDEFLESNKEEGVIKKHVDKNGAVFPVEVFPSKIELRGEKLIIVSARNISKRLQKEEKIKRNERALKEANTSKDRYFSILAHDLRTPLIAFLGLSKTLSEEALELSPKELQEMFGSLRISAESLYKLLENLLQWAEVQRGDIKFSPKNVNLNDIATVCASSYRTNAENKSVTINNQIDDDIQAYADSFMTETIIRNLISNAIKFSYENGEVIIKNEIKDDFISISVEDFGIGLAKQKTENLFDLGEISSEKGTSGERGTGLGLILCDEFVRINGGEIWADVEREKGSKFIFTLPKAKL